MIVFFSTLDFLSLLDLVWRCEQSPKRSTMTYIQRDSRAIISGWGKTTENGNKSAILQQAVVCVFENSVCQVGDPLIICAGVTETIVDTCNGDSGGPLIAACLHMLRSL